MACYLASRKVSQLTCLQLAYCCLGLLSLSDQVLCCLWCCVVLFLHLPSQRMVGRYFNLCGTLLKMCLKHASTVLASPVQMWDSDLKNWCYAPTLNGKVGAELLEMALKSISLSQPHSNMVLSGTYGCAYITVCASSLMVYNTKEMCVFVLIYIYITINFCI